MKKMKKVGIILLMLLISISLISCVDFDLGDSELEDQISVEESENYLEEDGYYTSKEDVSLYVNTFGKLPNNYITKSEAKNLGWESSDGNLWDVTDKMSIGGDKFGNRENLLPAEKGRQYYECDIDYQGGYRGGKRLVFSNDGLIYYTEDHYKSFDLLYGDE